MATVYLVGAGPGAVDLITVRCARLLAQADLILYDALVSDDILALAPQAKKIRVGKRCGSVSIDQRFINRCLVDAAQKYQTVLRLKGGDPMLFGRAHEEIEALRAGGISFEVVPGVTTALAAASELGISLTRRGLSRSVTFVTPRVGSAEEASDWASHVIASDTAVLYMAAQQIEDVATTLIEGGLPLDRSVVIIENVSLPQSRKFYTTLGELRSGLSFEFVGPAVVLVGEVFASACADAMSLENFLSALPTSTAVGV